MRMPWLLSVLFVSLAHYAVGTHNNFGDNCKASDTLLYAPNYMQNAVYTVETKRDPDAKVKLSGKFILQPKCDESIVCNAGTKPCGCWEGQGGKWATGITAYFGSYSKCFCLPGFTQNWVDHADVSFTSSTGLTRPSASSYYGKWHHCVRISEYCSGKGSMATLQSTTPPPGRQTYQDLHPVGHAPFVGFLDVDLPQSLAGQHQQHCLCDEGYYGTKSGPLADAHVQCNLQYRPNLCGDYGYGPKGQRYANLPPQKSECKCDPGFYKSGDACLRDWCGRNSGVALADAASACGSQGRCAYVPPDEPGPTYPYIFLTKPWESYSMLGKATVQCICTTSGADPRGGEFCCPVAENMIGGTQEKTCGQKGVCKPGGVCQCNSGYGGKYCCPANPSTGVACSGTSGTCGLDAKCACQRDNQQHPLFIGDACQFACPTSKGLSCGGNLVGSCVMDGTTRAKCTCLSGYKGESCCEELPPKGGGTPILCGGRGTCTRESNGYCVCNAGLDGEFCCPRLPTQTKACGNHGTCQRDGTCKCDLGYGGEYCEKTIFCEMSSTNRECRDMGACNYNEEGQRCIRSLWLEASGTPVILADGQTSVVYNDPGPFHLIRLLRRAFNGTQTSLANEKTSQYSAYLGHLKADRTCGPVGSVERWTCLRKMVEEYTKNNGEFVRARDAFLGGGQSTTTNYADVVLNRLYPNLTGSVINHRVIFAPYLSSVDHTIRTGIALDILCYGIHNSWDVKLPTDTANHLLRVTLSANRPAEDKYSCDCGLASNPDLIGNETVPAGRLCQLTCKNGLNGVPCSGYVNGQLRGVCSTSMSQTDAFCKCTTHFGGGQCTENRAACFPDGYQGSIPCTSPEHGTCVPASNTAYKCECKPEWTGTHCQETICRNNLDPGQDMSVECSGYGDCLQTNWNGVVRSCDCFLPNNNTLINQPLNAQPPRVPVGDFCNLNGVSDCGQAKPSKQPGLLDWTICGGANRGRCIRRLGDTKASCLCQTGYYGSHCQQSYCSTECNERSTCSPSDGKCKCRAVWENAQGVPEDSPDFCSISKCAHGSPHANGDSCECENHWAKDTQGSCTVPICPWYVVVLGSGERIATDKDVECISATGYGCARPPCRSTSRQDYESNPTLHCNIIDGKPKCLRCHEMDVATDSGICRSMCNGYDYKPKTGGGYECDCRNLQGSSTSYVNFTDCTLIHCMNGAQVKGTGVVRWCDCDPTGYGGAVCNTPSCGATGYIAKPGDTTCTCHPPYARLPGQGKCITNTCGTYNGAEIQVKNGICDCPSTMLLGPDGYSCETLQCGSKHANLCREKCANGTATVQNGALKCTCASGYEGERCDKIICVHGTRTASGDTCTCNFPWSGIRCETPRCVHGSLNLAQTGCACSAGYEGDLCDTRKEPEKPPSSTGGDKPPVRESSSTGTSVPSKSSSSSSSTGISEDTGSDSSSSSSSSTGPAVVPSSEEDTAYTVEIIAATGAAVGTASLAGAVFYLYKKGRLVGLFARRRPYTLI